MCSCVAAAVAKRGEAVPSRRATAAAATAALTAAVAAAAPPASRTAPAAALGPPGLRPPPRASLGIRTSHALMHLPTVIDWSVPLKGRRGLVKLTM